MSLKLSQATAIVVIAAVAMLFQPMSPDASADIHDLIRLDQTGCLHRCPACDYHCKLDAEWVDEEKSCFDVETKVICIPRVVFPWQRKKCLACDACDGQGCTSCVNNGARTRRIRVLKTDSYKCPKCKYTWSAEKKAPVSDAAHAAGPDSVHVRALPRPLAPINVGKSSRPISAPSGTMPAGDMDAGAKVWLR